MCMNNGSGFVKFVEPVVTFLKTPPAYINVGILDVL